MSRRSPRTGLAGRVPRAAAEAMREHRSPPRPTTAERVRETGTRGEGGDRTLVIDAAAEDGRLRRARARCTRRAHRFTAVSEERGDGRLRRRPGVRVVIDPIDGSLNAKRGLPHHALSIAVADGPTMADVVFGYVYDFGPERGVVARRGEGALLDGDAAGSERSAERRARDGRLEVLGVESADPRWVRAVGRRLAERRAPPARARARSPCRCARSRRRGSTAWSRCGAAARSTPPPAQLIVREAGGLVAFTGCDDPLGAPLDLVPHSPVVAARREAARLARGELARAGRARRCADQPLRSPAILEHDRLELAGTVAGGRRGAPAGAATRRRSSAVAGPADESRAARRRLHGPARRRAAAAAEAVDRPQWIDAQPRRAAAACSTRSPRARRPAAWAAGRRRRRRGGRRARRRGRRDLRLPGRRVLGQYEFPVLEPDAPARLLFVAPNLGHAARTLDADAGGAAALGRAARDHPRAAVRRRAVAAAAPRRAGARAAGGARRRPGPAAGELPGARRPRGARSTRSARAASSPSWSGPSGARCSTACRPSWRCSRATRST